VGQTTLRRIVHLDEDQCDGCGQCVPACEQGAIRVIDGKARLIDERRCDGLGDCIGECPQGAITLQERQVPAFDEFAVSEHLAHAPSPCTAHAAAPHTCPSAEPTSFSPEVPDDMAVCAPGVSQLRNWPIQLHLVPPTAPWLEGANLLIAADCVAFALGAFHQQLLDGRQLIIACPKLDDTAPYVAKLAAIFGAHDICGVIVARMEVPCCAGLTALVRRANEAAAPGLCIQEVVVTLDGEVTECTS